MLSTAAQIYENALEKACYRQTTSRGTQMIWKWRYFIWYTATMSFSVRQIFSLLVFPWNCICILYLYQLYPDSRISYLRKFNRHSKVEVSSFQIQDGSSKNWKRVAKPRPRPLHLLVGLVAICKLRWPTCLGLGLLILKTLSFTLSQDMKDDSKLTGKCAAKPSVSPPGHAYFM